MSETNGVATGPCVKGNLSPKQEVAAPAQRDNTTARSGSGNSGAGTPRFGLLARLRSGLALGYLRYFPIERGKWRLMQFATRRFLVVALEPGLFIRVFGISHVEEEIIRRGMFERETVQAFNALLTPGMTVFDVGANIGQYTLVASRRVGPTGQVHAFEPTPHVLDKLHYNVALNRLANVRINPVAVSDHPGQATLYFMEPGDAGENTIIDSAGGTACGSVRTLTLDDYVAERGIGRVDLIKMDIEGAELLALQGARALLSGEDAPLLLLEAHPKTLGFSGHKMEELLGLLGQHGYRFYPVATYGRHTPDPWTNGLAIKPCHYARFPALGTWNLQPVRS